MTGDDVKRIRDQLGWSQTRMAAELGTDAGTISRWERGVRKPSRLAQKELERLARRAARSHRTAAAEPGPARGTPPQHKDEEPGEAEAAA